MTQRILEVCMLFTLLAGSHSLAQDHGERSLRIRDLCQRGDARARQGDFEAAEAFYRECLRCDAEDAEARMKLGNCLLKLRRLDEAQEEFNALLMRHPLHAPAYNNLALCHSESGRFQEALFCLEKALEIDPDFEPAARNKDRILSAIASVEARIPPPAASPEQAIERLEEFVEEDRLLEAYADAIRLQVKTRRAAEVLAKLGIKFLHAGKPGDAEKVAMIIYPCEGGQALADFILGASKRLQGETDEAIQLLTSASEACPEDLSPVLELGLAYLTRSKNDDLLRAEEALARCRILEPNDPRSLILLGYLDEARGRFEDAQNRFESALSLNGDLIHAWTGLGIVQCDKALYEEARRCLEKALELDPQFDEARLHLGICLWRLGRHLDGLAAIESLATSHDVSVRVRARELLLEMKASSDGPPSGCTN